jgi:translocation and assembly module TamA
MNDSPPPPRAPRFGSLALAAVALCVVAPRGQAADPQPYKVTIEPTGQDALDGAVKDASTLISLHDGAPVGPFALIARARGDSGRFADALQSYGYYKGEVAITIAGRPLDDPGLADLLDEAPAGQDVPVDVKLTPGPQFHLRRVLLQGDVPEAARAKLAPLMSGDPARAADVVAAGNRVETALLESGHALAKVDPPVATLAPDADALDVTYAVHTGPRVDLGAIGIEGLDRVNESYVRRRLLLHPGEQYNPLEIEKARQDLAAQGVFSSVRIATGTTVGAGDTVPVTVTVSERPLHVVNFGASYSTDLGGALTASWTHRNLFGNAETLALNAAATELGGTAAKQPGYNVGPTLTFPDWLQRDQSLILTASAIKEYLQAYDRTAFTAGVTVSRKIDAEWTASVGLSAEQAKIVQEAVTRNYTLVQVPLTLAYDSAHELFEPTHGVKAALSLTPTESLSAPSATFVIAQISASTYIDLGAPGRSILALRGLIGSVEGGATFEIPPDQRFYGGGGGTIRGYRFQSVGPQFADHNPIGGTSIDVGTVEFRQRFGESYGAVAFVDAGQVGATSTPFHGALRVGAGIGARYYTALGPLRVDVAIPLNKQKGGDTLEAYIGIGQAF